MNNKKIQILYEGKYIRLIKRYSWEYIERHNCSGIVIIVPMTEDQKVVLVEQFRPPVQKKVIEFPAGLMNDRNDKRALKRESFFMAARRELFEETGYTAKRMRKLTGGPVSGGASSDLVTMIQALGLKKVGPGGGDETENIRVHEVPLKTVDRWLKKKEAQGCLIEPKVYSGLYFLNKYNG